MSSDVVGHAQHLKRFVTAGMPTVSLFEGPASVGKTTMALWLRTNVLRVPDADFLHVKHLDAETAEVLARWLTRSSTTGDRRLAVVYLGESGWSAQSILLSALERIDRRTYLIFVAPGEISPPLASRTERFRFGLLSVAEVSEILKRKGFQAATADRLAEIAGGQIQPALDALETNEAKLHVVGVVRAIKNKDAKTLSSFSGRWSDTHTMLLTTLCMEAISQRPFLFTADDGEGVGRKLALQILTETRIELRPRLVIHSQLMNVLRGI